MNESAIIQSIIQSKKWNHDECRSLDHWSCCKDDYMWNHTTCNCECNKTCKISEYLDTKNCLCKKRLFGKLVLACEHMILNTTETSLNDKKETLFTLFHWSLFTYY